MFSGFERKMEMVEQEVKDPYDKKVSIEFDIRINEISLSFEQKKSDVASRAWKEIQQFF